MDGWIGLAGIYVVITVITMIAIFTKRELSTAKKIRDVIIYVLIMAAITVGFILMVKNGIIL